MTYHRPNPRLVSTGRRGATALATFVVVALLAVSGCSSGGSDAGSSTTKPAGPSKATSKPTTSTTSSKGTGGASKPFTGSDFYAVPKRLPAGRHGTLIRYQPLVELTTAQAAAYRIMYLSRSVPGRPIAVTGVAVVPKAPAPAGGRKVLTIAHGTTGIADTCAPSKSPNGAEAGLVAGPSAANGFLVAVTDYEGLGTPGRHPYLVGESEGRSTLDAARAAAQLPDAHAGKRLAIAGYSQGGHGALWAQQLAAKWTPEQKVVGTFAGAPASEISIVLAASGSPAVGPFGLLLIAGLAAADPRLDLHDVLTDAGIKALDVVDQQCVGGIAGALGGSRGPLIRPEGINSPAWKAAAKAQDAGTTRTTDPTLVIQSQTDDIVPIVFSQILFDRECAIKEVVERRVLPTGSHGTAAVPAYQQGLAWLGDRFDPNAAPAKSTCPGG